MIDEPVMTGTGAYLSILFEMLISDVTLGDMDTCRNFFENDESI